MKEELSKIGCLCSHEYIMQFLSLNVSLKWKTKRILFKKITIIHSA